MNNSIHTHINSEIGTLRGVIIHSPGKEVENMTPQNAQKSLYSDILNKKIVDNEYSLFKGALNKIAPTYEVTNLLEDALNDVAVKRNLIERIVLQEDLDYLKDFLLDLSPDKLTKSLIEGIPMKIDSLTKFIDYKEYTHEYALTPLPNLFFTRDASVSIYDKVLINPMANKVRERESLIMETIFKHSKVKGPTFSPFLKKGKPNLSIEGGDVLIVSDDILAIGLGDRTNSQGIDFLIDHFKTEKKRQHIIVQELPSWPESFIHLDMVFTFIDKHQVMIYAPLILHSRKHATYRIIIDNGQVAITEEKNMLTALKSVGVDVEPLYCGGSTEDTYNQEREQWHSGANFFALAPGRIIGYERNTHTIAELNKNGYDVLQAKHIVDGVIDPMGYKKSVIILPGSELPRGGGGCRCMTMPILRDPVE